MENCIYMNFRIKKLSSCHNLWFSKRLHHQVAKILVSGFILPPFIFPLQSLSERIFKFLRVTLNSYFRSFLLSVKIQERSRNSQFATNLNVQILIFYKPEAEFKEFERRLKFKPPLKYGWFHLKLYSIFQDLSRCLIETDFWRI